MFGGSTTSKQIRGALVMDAFRLKAPENNGECNRKGFHHRQLSEANS